jgi:type IV secretion system coupling TraD/TrwB family protein
MRIGHDKSFSTPYEISDNALAKHVFIIGKSGAGKSTLLLNMMVQDTIAGKGICLEDPHGDLADDFLRHIPRSRINDVIIIDPTSDHVPIVNVFSTDGNISRDISAADDLFHSVWPDAWFARSQWLFRMIARCLSQAHPKFSIVGVIKMIMGDSAYRQKVRYYTRDEDLKLFLDEYDRWTKQFKEQVVTPVQNKVTRFIESEFLRSVTGREESTFSFRWAMDNHKIIICRFPRGPMGKEDSTLLCSLISNKINNAALSRADSRHRPDFRLYVDEAGMALQGIDVPSLMSESRKYGLQLVFATQTLESIESISKDALASILGNCGTLLAFRLSARDAKYLDEEFYGQFPPDTYVGMPDREVMVRTMRRGIPSNADRVVTLPRLESTRTRRQEEDWIAKIKDTSKRRYAVSKKETFEKVNRFLRDN